ncbi:hypothetical protein [Rubrivirga sp.]|uniref:hypothetical protein n=1 Tax=Rubrivirga sp. TaxID=1885344 RepID=UPI003C728B61
MIRLLILLTALAGCTHTRPADLSSGTVRSEITSRAERGQAVVYVEGERGREARDLEVGTDVTTWVDRMSDEERSAPTSSLHAVAFRRDGLGALEGAAFGAATGVVVFNLEHQLSGGGSELFPGLRTVAGATIGFLVGLLVGVIRSDQYV